MRTIPACCLARNIHKPRSDGPPGQLPHRHPCRKPPLAMAQPAPPGSRIPRSPAGSRIPRSPAGSRIPRSPAGSRIPRSPAGLSGAAPKGGHRALSGVSVPHLLTPPAFSSPQDHASRFTHHAPHPFAGFVIQTPFAFRPLPFHPFIRFPSADTLCRLRSAYRHSITPVVQPSNYTCTARKCRCPTIQPSNYPTTKL